MDKLKHADVTRMLRVKPRAIYAAIKKKRLWGKII